MFWTQGMVSFLPHVSNLAIVIRTYITFWLPIKHFQSDDKKDEANCSSHNSCPNNTNIAALIKQPFAHLRAERSANSGNKMHHGQSEAPLMRFGYVSNERIDAK